MNQDHKCLGCGSTENLTDWYYVLLCFNNTKQKSLMELKTIRSIKI